MPLNDDQDRSYRPGWLRLAWFLGRPPELTRRQWRVLGLVAIVSLFEQYDLFLFALNLKHIQADLGMAESQLGWLGGLVRAGALPAIFVTLAADRLGRRRILLFTVIAYTLLTGATAFAPDAITFVALQFAARTFAAAETLIAVVVIAEEFDPENRGWGIGALGAIQACGAGLAALVFGFVDVLPFGWRSLYLLGLGPLVLVAYWRRTLPETDRFIAMQKDRADELHATPPLQPIADLVRAYPARFAALASVVFIVAVAASPAGFFAPKYLQDVHGFSPAAVAILTFTGGSLAIIANPFAGWLSDRRGRRPVTILFSVLMILFTVGYYNVVGAVVPAFWILMIFAFLGSDVTLSAYGAEMFPTSHRSTAAGARSIASTVGGVAGLGLVSVLFGVVGSNWSAITLLALAAVGVPFIVALTFPETAGRILEEIAPERSTAPTAVPVTGGLHVTDRESQG